jgi:UDP-glucuronate 4-epimerase
MENKNKVLITGGAGFIGSHLIDRLLDTNYYDVTCIDNFDPFYDESLKRNNISKHSENSSFKLIKADIVDLNSVLSCLDEKYDIIIHLAAKTGVRLSIKDPLLYQKVNVLGLQSMLEVAKIKGVKQFVFASSSSVYGINKNIPWNESQTNLMPISPYASSKISGEWLGKAYSLMYGIRFIALRLFTVYGPRQRPDLAICNFINKILNGEPINFFGDGSTLRDYTYVSDIVAGISASMTFKNSDFEIINLGNGRPVSLSELISSLEIILNKKAILNKLPFQEGDVPLTYADIIKAKTLLGFKPEISLMQGLENSVIWNRNCHNKSL